MEAATLPITESALPSSYLRTAMSIFGYHPCQLLTVPLCSVAESVSQFPCLINEDDILDSQGYV